MANAGETAWWRRTALLAGLVLAVWAVVGVAVPVLDLSFIKIDLRLPWPYVLAAFLVPLVMVIALFLFIPWQRAIDRRVDGSEG
jgi:putative solute:sodium symporter small subunit